MTAWGVAAWRRIEGHGSGTRPKFSADILGMEIPSLMPDPRVLSNSSMWQSERWNQTVTKIPAADSWLGSLRLAFQLVRRRRRFDAVYTVGVRPAQIYGLLCAVCGTGGRPHIASEILLDEARPESAAWRWKRKLRRIAFRKIAQLIVFSSGERQLYSQELELPLERVHFVPFHTNVLEPHRTEAGRYGFAAGRSLRDYRTLFQAVEGLEFPFVVVADHASVANLSKPTNVELHCDIPRARYLELLEGCAFVVVPLKADYRSTGQVVVLEAASLGKPVIASDVVGVRDYIADGVDGLLVEPANPEALRQRMEQMIGDPSLGQRLAEAALRRVNEQHTFAIFAGRCLDVIALACAGSGR